MQIHRTFSLVLVATVYAAPLAAIAAAPGFAETPEKDSASSTEPKQNADAGIEQLVEQFVKQLADDSAARRNEAERKLIELGAAAAARVAEAAADGDTETLYRAKRILSAIAASDDDAAARAGEAAIRTLAKSENTAAAKLGAELAKQFAPAEVADVFRKAVAEAKKRRDAGETHPDVIQAEWVDALIAKHGFRHVTGDVGPDGGAPAPADWYVNRDPDAHQELLVYRVKWFKGGWSRWFIPGVNDDDMKVKGHRMWRYFADHEWQRVEIPFKLGRYTSRRDFLGDAVEKPAKEAAE